MYQFFLRISNTPTESWGGVLVTNSGHPSCSLLRQDSLPLATQWVSSRFPQHKVISEFVLGWQWWQDVPNRVLFEGYSCHYLFLIKCLLQTRYHMGWWVPPHPARAKRDPAQMTLDGDAPGGASSQRRLWCLSGWQCDFQLFSVMPQRHFKCLSDANQWGQADFGLFICSFGKLKIQPLWNISWEFRSTLAWGEGQEIGTGIPWSLELNGTSGPTMLQT